MLRCTDLALLRRDADGRGRNPPPPRPRPGDAGGVRRRADMDFPPALGYPLRAAVPADGDRGTRLHPDARTRNHRRRAGGGSSPPLLSRSGIRRVRRGQGIVDRGARDAGPPHPRGPATQPAGDLGYRFALSYILPTPALPGDPGAPYGVATGHDKDYGAFFVSSGPYMVEGSERLDFTLPPGQQQPASGLVPGRSLTLVRNPSWSAASDPLRPAYADRIVLTVTRTKVEASAAVDRGEADLALEVGPGPRPLDQILAYQADRQLGRVEVRPADTILLLSMNLAVPPFDDLHVRRAVAYAIDRQAALRAYGGSLFGSATGHIALDSMEDNALLTFDPYRTKDAAARIAAARREMALSRYDTDHAGVCDVAACRHIRVLADAGATDTARAAMEATVPAALADIGMMIDLRQLARDPFFTQLGGSASRTPMGIGWAFGKNYPNGGDFFSSMFAASSIGSANGLNYSLVGATAEQLRAWGYPVTSVPNVDDRIAQCVPLVGTGQTRCWTALDQYLVQEVVPVVPLLTVNYVQVIPSRIVGYSFDQYATLPALDRIAVKH